MSLTRSTIIGSGYVMRILADIASHRSLRTRASQQTLRVDTRVTVGIAGGSRTAPTGSNSIRCLPHDSGDPNIRVDPIGRPNGRSWSAKSSRWLLVIGPSVNRSELTTNH